MSESNQNENENENPNDNGEGENVEGLKTALQKEREARKTAERTSKDLEKRLAAIENSGKSDAEKLAARLKELEDDVANKSAAIRERDARDAVRDAATKAGASNPDPVYRMVKGDIEYDDDGKPTNLAALIKDAKEIAPQLFRPATGKGDGGSGTKGSNANNDMNAVIRRAAGYTS